MIPSIMELTLPVLKILADGELHGKSEIDKAVAAEFGISEDEMREKISCGANKFKNRMGWAVLNLKGKGLIIKEGKQYKITDLGGKALTVSPEKLTTKFVKSLAKSDKSDNDPDDPDDSDDTPQDTGSEPEAPAASPGASTDTDLSAYAGMDPNTEFMLAVRAKYGDKKAFAELWNKYRSMMCGMFRFCKNLTEDERVSEAALVLVKKIELFQPDKVNKKPEEWTFSYMLTGGVKNARDKIIRHSMKESKHDFDYMEDLPPDTATDSAYVNAFATSVEINKFEYTEKYNPEVHALKTLDVSLEDKESALMKSLSPFQITVLKFRQAGLTIQQIADEMGCGFTKVRLQIVEARQTASAIFGVEYC